jgi:hypothetical protein
MVMAQAFRMHIKEIVHRFPEKVETMIVCHGVHFDLGVQHQITTGNNKSELRADIFNVLMPKIRRIQQ